MTAVLIQLPEWAWQKAEMRQALRGRNMGAVLRFVQQYGGVSQARIATAAAMTQGRVNEIINGRREVSRLDVYERIADGLDMPDDARHLLGLATRDSSRRSFELAAFPEIVRVYRSQESAREEIQHQAGSATEMDILAVRGLGIIGLNNSLLRSHLARSCGEPPRVRVLLLDPAAATLSQRAAEIGESAESLAHGVLLAEARMKELSAVCELEVYRYRTLPTWRIIRIDSVLYVSAFDAEWEGHESATYKIMETPQGPLYRGFRRMFDAILTESERTV